MVLRVFCCFDRILPKMSNAQTAQKADIRHLRFHQIQHERTEEDGSQEMGDERSQGPFVASLTSVEPGGPVHSFRREFGSLEDRRGELPRRQRPHTATVSAGSMVVLGLDSTWQAEVIARLRVVHVSKRSSLYSALIGVDSFTHLCTMNCFDKDGPWVQPSSYLGRLDAC